MGVCVHIHTDYMYGRWRGAWNTDLVFLDTDFYLFEHGSCFFEHEFYFFEHEFHELNESWCLRNLNLARIKRIFMNGTGTRNYSKGSHTDLTDLTDLTLTDFLMQGRMTRWKEYLKTELFRGKPMVFLCAEMNIYAKQEEEMYKYLKQWL